MQLADAYASAKRAEEIARLRRVLALRAMVASGLSQRQIGQYLDLSQPAISQQLKAAPEITAIHPELLLEAAAPVLKEIAARHGYSRLAVFGSVARNEARLDSDIDLLVEAPEGTSSLAFMKFKNLLELTLGRPVDLAPYKGLNSLASADIIREAVIL